MMDKVQRKLRRSPSLKRRSKVLPIGQRLTLERVLGLTVSSSAAFTCDPTSGVVAYPAGCVVVLFNPRKNRQSHIFNVSKKTITSIAFSADGKHLVTGESGHQPAVRVWEVEEKTQVAEFHGHKFGINCVAFSPNQKYIVSIGSQHDMVVSVWNWRTGNRIASNKVSCKVSSVAFGSDSSFFVTVGNRHVKFWYLDNSQSKINQTVPLLGHSGILGEHKNNYFCDVACGYGKTSGNTFAITQSGLLCAFNDKRLLDKWVELKAKNANCITAGEELIYIGCAEGVVRVFSAGSLQFVANLPYPHHLGVDVATATSSSDLICTETDAKFPDVVALTLDDRHKKVACVYNDHSLYVWDVMNVRRVGKAWSFLFHSGCVWALEVYPGVERGQTHTQALPPGSFLTASTDNTIRVWNLDPRVSQTPGYRHNVYSSELLKIVYTDPSLSSLCDVDYNPAGGTDKTDRTWDGKNGVRSIRVSPDGRHLASGDRQGNIRIYDLHQMSEIRCIEAHESDVVCLEYSFSKAGTKILASGGRDRLIHVFDVDQHYGLLQTLDDHSAAIQSVRFTDADNTLRMLSCGSDKSLLFRNAALSTGFEFSLDQHLVSKSTMYDMIIDPTHKFVATACQDRNIRIYNMKTAKQKKHYHASLGDEGTLLRVQLDPSGTYAATSCTDKNVCVLDFYTGELTATVYGHSETVTGLRFTHDLKHLLSVSADGCIFVWRLPSEMTKTMRRRMEQLGKMPKDDTSVLDTSMEGTRLVPSPALLDSTYTTSSSSAFPESISPCSVLSSMNLRLSSFSSGSHPHPPSAYPHTPVRKRGDSNLLQPSPAHQHLFVGPLPSWAKLDETCDGSDPGQDPAQPKGRWAQRFDQNLAFKSQLDLSQREDADLDSRTGTGEDGGGGLQGGMLTSSMPDLRRETVVLTRQHLPAKNIPIIDDDDETNIDDDEDFYPAYLNDKLPKNENERISSEEVGSRRRTVNGDLLGGRSSDGVGFPHWSNQTSLDSEDTAHSTDWEDLEDSDALLDATRIIYPPSKPGVGDTCDSTYQVFAADEIRKRIRGRTSSTHTDEDDGPWLRVSVEGSSDVQDEARVTSLPSGSQPHTDGSVFLPTLDKEQFVKENFDSVRFTPVAMDRFAQQVASLEQAADVSIDQTGGLPFSPRLSLSSRFLSRSHFVGVRSEARLGTRRNVDNHLNSVPESKSILAHSMEDMRKRLAAMNWRTGGLIQESPEKDDPHSPPTKLENKEPSFSTPISSSHGSLGACGSASPRTLPRTCADSTLSHLSVRREHPLPKIPVPHTLNVLKEKAVGTSECTVSNKSDLPVRDMALNGLPVRDTALKGLQSSVREYHSPRSVQKQQSSPSHPRKTPKPTESFNTTFVRISRENRSPFPGLTDRLQTGVSQLPHSPQLVKSLRAISDCLSQSSQDLAQSQEATTSPRSLSQTSLSPNVESQDCTVSSQRQFEKTGMSALLTHLQSERPRSPLLSHLQSERPRSPLLSHLQSERPRSPLLTHLQSERPRSPHMTHLQSERPRSPHMTHLQSERPRSPLLTHLQSERPRSPLLTQLQSERPRSPHMTHLQSERPRSPLLTHLQSERCRSPSPHMTHLQSERPRSPLLTQLQSERPRSPLLTQLQSERPRSTSPHMTHLQSERPRSTSPQESCLHRNRNPESSQLLTESPCSTDLLSAPLRSDIGMNSKSSYSESEKSPCCPSSPLKTEKRLCNQTFLLQTEMDTCSDGPFLGSEQSTSFQFSHLQSGESICLESTQLPLEKCSSAQCPPSQPERHGNPRSLPLCPKSSEPFERRQSPLQLSQVQPVHQESALSPDCVSCSFQSGPSVLSIADQEGDSVSTLSPKSAPLNPQSGPYAPSAAASQVGDSFNTLSPNSDPHSPQSGPYVRSSAASQVGDSCSTLSPKSAPQNSQSGLYVLTTASQVGDSFDTLSPNSAPLNPQSGPCAHSPSASQVGDSCSTLSPNSDPHSSQNSISPCALSTAAGQTEGSFSSQSPNSNPHSSQSGPCAQSTASQAGESVLASCHTLPCQPELVGLEMPEAGEELEKENSPILSVPARNVPCVTHRTSSKPSHKTAPASTKAKRLSTDRAHSQGAKGPRSSSVPPFPRQAPSYCRATQASRLKSAPSGNLMKQAEGQQGAGSSAAVSGEKLKGAGRTKKGRLSSSAQGRHKSTPNLITYSEMEKNTTEQALLEESSSNLRDLANMSFSDSDIASIENTTYIESSASVCTVLCRGEKTDPLKLHAWGDNLRRGQSLPTEDTSSQKRRPCQDCDVTYTVLMPPPPAETSDTQRRLLRRSAAQGSKGSASSLTLEQAKNILLGNSGILEVPQIGPQVVSTSSDSAAQVSDRAGKPENASDIVTTEKDTCSHVLHRNFETVSSTSKSGRSPDLLQCPSQCVDVYSSPVFCDTASVADCDPASVSHTAQTVHTGRQPHSVDILTNPVSSPVVDVTRFDTPEHDKPKPQQNTQSCGSSANSLLHSMPADDDDKSQETSDVSVVEGTAPFSDSLQRDSLGAGGGSVHTGACPDPCRILDSGQREVSSELLTGQTLLELKAPNAHLSSDCFDLPCCSMSTLGQSLSSTRESVLSCIHLSHGETTSLRSQISQVHIGSSLHEQTLSCSQSPGEQISSPCSHSPQGQTSSCSQLPGEQTSCSQSPGEQTSCSQSPGEQTSLCSLSPQGQTLSSCSQSPDQNVSPRSRCDTGLGSETDTDSDTHQYPLSKRAEQETLLDAGSDGHLPIHPHNSYIASPPAVGRSQELMAKCTNIVNELKTAVQRTKDFHSEVNQTKTPNSAPSHQQMMNQLSDAILQAHHTLAELAVHTPVTAHTSGHARFCPLTEGAVPWDTTVVEQARNMLQPFVWSLSQELTKEVVKVVHEQLEGGSSSS